MPWPSASTGSRPRWPPSRSARWRSPPRTTGAGSGPNPPRSGAASAPASCSPPATGEDLGYAIVRRTHKWENSLPQGSLVCSDLTAADPAARLALVRRLVAFDLIGSVSLPAASLDDEVVWWLGGPRAVKARVHDALWLRVLDVGAALPLRGYAADVDVVLDVSDERCPWNARRWRLAASGGRATCEPTDAPADLRLPVQVLGSAYLGGRSVAAMARQGLVDELAPGAVRAVSRALATDVAPAAALMF